MLNASTVPKDTLYAYYIDIAYTHVNKHRNTYIHV